MEALPRERRVWTMLWWGLVKAFVEENLFSRMVLNVLAASSTLLVSGARFDVSNIPTLSTLHPYIAHFTRLTCPNFWVSVSHWPLMFHQNLHIQMRSVGFGASRLVYACDSSFQILDCGCAQKLPIFWMTATSSACILQSGCSISLLCSYVCPIVVSWSLTNSWYYVTLMNGSVFRLG